MGRGEVKATNMQELVRHAKDNPGKVNFGSAGVGTSQHMAGELFKQLADIDKYQFTSPTRGQRRQRRTLYRV